MNNSEEINLLKENMEEGYARHRVVFDKHKKAVDYVFLDINKKFKRLTGLQNREIKGKKASQVLKNSEKAINWLESYNKLKNGESDIFQNYIPPVDKWFEVKIFSEKNDLFTVLIKDISSLKENTQKTKKLVEFINKMQLFSLDDIKYKFFTDSIQKLSGASTVILNLLAKNNKNITITEAVSGVSGKLTRLLDRFDFNLEGVEWDTDYNQLKETKENGLIQFSSFKEIGYYDCFPEMVPLLEKIDKFLVTGDLFSLKIHDEGEPLGFITLIMPDNRSLENKGIIEIYINQITEKIKEIRSGGQPEVKEKNQGSNQDLLLDNIRYHVWLLKDNQTYESVNQVHADFLGMDKEEIIDKNIFEILSQKEAQRIVKGNEEVLKQKQTLNTREWLTDKNGKQRLLSVNRIPVTDNENIVKYVVCSAEDITENLKEAEDNMYQEIIKKSKNKKEEIEDTFIENLEMNSFGKEKHYSCMLNVAQKIGVKTGLPENELTRLKELILLHDIGKINIPEEILTKKGPLKADEWEMIMKHPEMGSKIARETEKFSHIAEEIYAHHEHWDGSGYPRGLKGEEIYLLARITAIAEAYEVMVNGRPYKDPMTQQQIIDELKACSGKQFDPELIEVFLEILKEEKDI